MGREAVAWARQGQLILTRAGRRTRPQPSGASRAVMFVHGFGAAGAVFEPLRRKVEAQLGVPTLDFTYGSHWPFGRVTDALSRAVDARLDDGQRLDLVGHSLGGIVARWYVQELGGAARVDRVVTMATPHAGTRSARVAPGPLRSVLLPESPVVRRLERGRHRASDVTHTALVAGRDVMVSPPSSAAAIRDAEVRWFDDHGHNAMLYAKDVHDAVVRALAEPARSSAAVSTDASSDVSGSLASSSSD